MQDSTAATRDRSMIQTSRLCLSAIAFAVLAGATPARAADNAPDNAPTPIVDHGWFTSLPNNGPTLGFFTITNKGGDPRLMTGFSSPACKTLKLEEAHSGSVGAGTGPGLLRMTVAGKSRMAFVRGGYHLVCAPAGSALTIGKTVPVTISFLSGKPVTASFEIRPLPKS